MVGLAPKTNFQKDHYNYTTCGYYFYIYTGTLYSQAGDNNKEYHERIRLPTTIEVYFNKQQKTIGFKFDGVDKGVAFEDVDVSQDLFPALDFYDAGAKLELL